MIFTGWLYRIKGRSVTTRTPMEKDMGDTIDSELQWRARGVEDKPEQSPVLWYINR